MLKKILSIAFCLSLLVVSGTQAKLSAPPKTLIASDFKPVVVDLSTIKPILEPVLSPPVAPTQHPTKKIEPKAKVEPKYTRQATPKRGILRGTATWYCLRGVSSCHKDYPDRKGVADYYAAAGSEVRNALGPKWRGQYVYVTHNNNTIKVKLVDWCACKGKRVIDLYADAFKKLDVLGKGVISVKVSK